MRLNDLLLVFLIIGAPIVFAQPSNDNCSAAARLCPGTTLSGTTTGATVVAGSDNYPTCFTSSATVWYVFTTNSLGGTVTVDFANLTFNPNVNMGQQLQAMIITASTPCSTPSYGVASACGEASANFSVTSAAALAPNTTYYVFVNGKMGTTLPAECDFDISISGPGIDKIAPTASLSSTNTVLCQGDEELVNATVNNCEDTVSFEWYYANSLIGGASSSTYDVGAQSTSGYLKLIITCDLICPLKDTTDSIYFDITAISANAGPDKFIESGDQVTLDGSGDGVPLWTPAVNLTSATSFTPIASPTQTTTYFLSVSSGTCTASDSVNVFVGEVITVYTTFTPNGDNINDKWVIRNSAQFENIEIWVYDRSGQEVFHATNYDTQDKWWDGTFQNKGKPLPASTYFYVVDLKEGDYPKYKGSVTLIR